MAKEYSKSFYNSIAWKECRESFLKSRNYLCEECLKKGILTPASDVHHIIEITPDNITNPRITLNHKNLKALCKECHNREHSSKTRRYTIDKHGHVCI